MINKKYKIISGIVFGFFVFMEITMFLVGEGVMFGIRVFDDVIRLHAGIMIIVSSIGIVLIFKDKIIGYVIVILPIVITLIIYFGHRMLWWPCEYCSF